MPKIAKGEMEKRKGTAQHWQNRNGVPTLIYGNGCFISPAQAGLEDKETGCFVCPLPDCVDGLSPRKLERLQLELFAVVEK